jgi:hypothetical protein
MVLIDIAEFPEISIKRLKKKRCPVREKRRNPRGRMEYFVPAHPSVDTVQDFQKNVFNVVENRQAHESDDEDETHLLVDHLGLDGNGLPQDALHEAKHDLPPVHDGNGQKVHDEKHQ